jgi:hypothetical protein
MSSLLTHRGLPHGVYPDDFDLQAPNPNTHISAVRIPVYLEAHDHKKILPTLQQNGVQFSNLTAQLPGLQRVLQRLANATARTGSERLDDEHVAAVRQVFEWSLLRLTDHSSLTILHAEPAGIITRSTGRGVQFHEGSGGIHRTSRGQFWKLMIHGDQDVHGSPIRELLWGLAPLLFARASPLKLLNVWMPVQRVRVQPLVVMDLASLNESDRLHYHIHSSDRLGARLNDCWTFTHRPEQRWLTHALPWEAGQAFSTLCTRRTAARPILGRRTQPRCSGGSSERAPTALRVSLRGRTLKRRRRQQQQGTLPRGHAAASTERRRDTALTTREEQRLARLPRPCAKRSTTCARRAACCSESAPLCPLRSFTPTRCTRFGAARVSPSRYVWSPCAGHGRGS